MTHRLSSPVLNVWRPAYLTLAQRGRLDGIRTILTGRGGDEGLTISPFLAADLLRAGRLVDLARLIATIQRSYQLSIPHVFHNLLWSCGLRPLIGQRLHRLVPAAHRRSRLSRLIEEDPCWVAPDPALRAEQRRRAEHCLPDPDPAQGFYVREVRTSLDHAIVSWEFEEEHEFGEQIGVRFQHPFADVDLTELLCRMPPMILNSDGRTKSLVRQSLARRFPTLGFERQRKVSAITFYRSLLRRELPALVDTIGDFPVLSSLGVVDGPQLCRSIREELGNPNGRCRRVWQPINLEGWARLHLEVN